MLHFGRHWLPRRGQRLIVASVSARDEPKAPSAELSLCRLGLLQAQPPGERERGRLAWGCLAAATGKRKTEEAGGEIVQLGGQEPGEEAEEDRTARQPGEDHHSAERQTWGEPQPMRVD